ncbi:hypothetical protein J6590_047978 [Homalodisca vitripennis]|nr:hypothetical protein J6590_047978 [Homalodisca vitripennis]
MGKTGSSINNNCKENNFPGSKVMLSICLLGAMFPLPRVLYAMAHDGILFDFFCLIHPSTQTPVLATLASGVFAGYNTALALCTG